MLAIPMFILVKSKEGSEQDGAKNEEQQAKSEEQTVFTAPSESTTVSLVEDANMAAKLGDPTVIANVHEVNLRPVSPAPKKPTGDDGETEIETMDTQDGGVDDVNAAKVLSLCKFVGADEGNGKNSETNSEKKDQHYQCTAEDCDLIFPSLQKARNHVVLAHMRKNVILLDCGDQLPSKEALEERLAVQFGRKMKCPVKSCGMRFYDKKLLSEHKATHVEDRDFKCTFSSCRKKFLTNASLRRHVLTHINERQLTCGFDGCGETFTEYAMLKVHVLVHTGEKPYACPHQTCEERYADLESLNRHAAIHNDEGKRPCFVRGCFRKFSDNHEFKQHLARHPGKGPFQCSVVGCERYSLPHNRLMIHFNTHNTEFKCPKAGCGQTFSAHFYLENHMRSHREKKPRCGFRGCGILFDDKPEMVPEKRRRGKGKGKDTKKEETAEAVATGKDTE